MPNIEEQIKEIEEEIKNTKYNKATQHHIGRLKAKLSRLKDESDKRRSSIRGAKISYAVKKFGNATVCLVGSPSVGKSTLLNKLTNAQSEVAEYEFTTLNVIPGIMEYKGAKIQILDLPGLIKGASRGRGRGREVLSVVRNADLILLMVDGYQQNIDVLVKELYDVGIRLNTKQSDVVIAKKERGGINLNTTVKLTKIDELLVKAIFNEYGIINADVVLREDVDEEQLIDAIAQNRVYSNAFVVINKIDLITKRQLENAIKNLNSWKVISISAEKEIGLEKLREEIFNTLKFVRIYMRPQGGETDFKEPLVIKEGSTIGNVCDVLHRDFRNKFRYAQVWGRSAKFDGQRVGLNHVLKDEDILTLILRK